MPVRAYGPPRARALLALLMCLAALGGCSTAGSADRAESPPAEPKAREAAAQTQTPAPAPGGAGQQEIPAIVRAVEPSVGPS